LILIISFLFAIKVYSIIEHERSSTNTVIATHNIHPADTIWGEMKYEDYEVNISGEMCKIETEN
jgi:hypothetical protein